MSSADSGESSIASIHARTEATKYLALVSCAFLIYDILITLPSEVRYVWGSRWSFGRVAFHLNRIWAPLMLACYVPSLFLHYLTNERCFPILLFYIYGTVFAMLVATSVLVTRLWAIYEMKKWVIVTLCVTAAGILIPSIAIILWQAKQCELAPNPAPEIISGCRFKTTPLAIIPYITPFLFDTALFGMTVRKIWKSEPTPLMTRLLQDGLQYYLIVMGTFLFVGFSSIVPATSDAVNGSGLFIAVLSSMCTRLILSTRSYYDEDLFLQRSVEMSTLSGPLHVRSGDRGARRRTQQQSTTGSIA